MIRKNLLAKLVTLSASFVVLVATWAHVRADPPAASADAAPAASSTATHKRATNTHPAPQPTPRAHTRTHVS